MGRGMAEPLPSNSDLVNFGPPETQNFSPSLGFPNDPNFNYNYSMIPNEPIIKDIYGRPILMDKFILYPEDYHDGSLYNHDAQ